MSVRASRPGELERLLAIRHEVFVVGQRVPEDLEVDGLDPACRHFVAEDDGQLVGTARLRVTPDGRAKAERVAVLERARGRGLGRELMRAIEDEARRLGFEELVLYAQVNVVPFYARLGYVAVGAVFEEAGIGHLEMRLRLSGLAVVAEDEDRAV